MVSKLQLILGLIVIAFPLTTGSVLTVLGIGKFSEANIRITSKEPSPYGILAFGSVDCELTELALFLHGFDMKNNVAEVNVHFAFNLLNASPRKHVFGVQVPYIGQPITERPPTISASNESGQTLIDLETANFTTMITGMERDITKPTKELIPANNTSLVFFEFEALNQLTFQGTLWFLWRDFMIRQTFSTHEVLVPFSRNDHGRYNVVYKYFPEAHLMFGDELKGASFWLSVPSGVRILESTPPPSWQELMWVTRGVGWHVSVDSFSYDEPCSQLIRLSVQDTELSDIRDRLLFDSGLYMGLGMGLLLGGVHEATKFAAEKVKKPTT